MVKAIGVFAGFATEREEVELVAVGVVAVGANGVKIFVRSLHCSERLRFCGATGGGRWRCHGGY